MRETRGGLGDRISAALSAVGVTEERVSSWLQTFGHRGGCNCGARREALNRLGRWALRIVTGKAENGKEYLEEILKEKGDRAG